MSGILPIMAIQGLTERVRKSTVSESQAAQATLNFLSEWVPQGASPMCGNSIGQDRRFSAICPN